MSIVKAGQQRPYLRAEHREREEGPDVSDFCIRATLKQSVGQEAYLADACDASRRTRTRANTGGRGAGYGVERGEAMTVYVSGYSVNRKECVCPTINATRRGRCIHPALQRET